MPAEGEESDGYYIPYAVSIGDILFLAKSRIILRRLFDR